MITHIEKRRNAQVVRIRRWCYSFGRRSEVKDCGAAANCRKSVNRLETTSVCMTVTS